MTAAEKAAPWSCASARQMSSKKTRQTGVRRDPPQSGQRSETTGLLACVTRCAAADRAKELSKTCRRNAGLSVPQRPWRDPESPYTPSKERRGREIRERGRDTATYDPDERHECQGSQHIYGCGGAHQQGEFDEATRPDESRSKRPDVGERNHA